MGKCQCLDINILQRPPPQERLSKAQTFCSSTLYHGSISAQDFFCFSSYLKNTAFILKSNLICLQQLLGLDFSAVWILFSPVRNQESPESEELRWGGSLPGANGETLLNDFRVCEAATPHREMSSAAPCLFSACKTRCLGVTEEAKPHFWLSRWFSLDRGDLTNTKHGGM